mgnify:CR=1 FL=1
MVHIERHRDPALVRMEAEVFAKLQEISGPPPAPEFTGKRKSGLPSDNKQISVEEALSELRAMGASIDPTSPQ